MSGSLWFLVQQFLLLVVAALLFTWLGWWLRGKLGKFGATVSELDAERTRAATAEDRIKKAEAETKSAVAELATLKGRGQDRTELDKALQELAAERAKSENFNSQLKKSREAQIASEARIAESNKTAQAKIFEAQNEVAKMREENARSNQLALEAQTEIAKAKGVSSAIAGEVKELGNQVIALRKESSAAIKTAEDAKTARDNAVAELATIKDKVTKLEEELAQVRTRANIVATPVSTAVTTIAAAAAPRGVSEEQFNAVRSALNNAQKERDAAKSAQAEAQAENEQLIAELAAVKSGSAQADISTLPTTSVAEAGSASGVIDAASGDSVSPATSS